MNTTDEHAIPPRMNRCLFSDQSIGTQAHIGFHFVPANRLNARFSDTAVNELNETKPMNVRGQSITVLH
jgi:hypothetical protein